MDRNTVTAVVIVGAVVGLAYLGQQEAAKKPAPVRPIVVPVPAPPKCPDCPNCPAPNRRPWAAGTAAQVCADVCEADIERPKLPRPKRPLLPRPRPRPQPKSCCTVGDPEPANDLLAMPSRKRNIAASGLGCCVFRSIDYASQWQNVPVFRDFPEWMVSKRIPGGGTPGKVDQLIPKICADRNTPVPPYVQYQGRDPSIIELALKTGRSPCVTWNGNHMLTCVHLDQQQGAILDNNAPDRVQWMSRAQFLSKWTAGGGGWVFVLLNPGPPPAPRSLVAPRMAQDCSCSDNCPSCRAGQCRAEACVCAAHDATTWSDLAWRTVRGKTCPCSSLCVCGCNQGLPCQCVVTPLPSTPDDATLMGVSWTYEGRERWQIGSRAATREQVEATLVDDSSRLRLTLIGAQPDRERALAQLGPLSGYVVQGYEPGAWELSVGFVAQGAPSVYLQAPSGQVLLRKNTDVGLAAALRRADPSYDPAKDPTGTPAVSADPLAWAMNLPTPLKLAAGLGLALLVWLGVRQPSGQSTSAAAPARATSQPAVQAQLTASVPVPTTARQIEELMQRAVIRRLEAQLAEIPAPRPV